jgi:ubiquinone/menaquinone biosynthesis C-methylase UbiE
MARTGHWDEVYRRSAATAVSWFQPEPTGSLELIAMADVQPIDPILDVGGGASVLVDRLLAAGHGDVTVLDVAADVLALAQQRLRPLGDKVNWIAHDL